MDAPEMILEDEENLFRYCTNNPVNNSDPYGYSNTSLLLGIVGVILSLVGMFSAPRMVVIAITCGIAIAQLVTLIRDQNLANKSLKKANLSTKEYNRLKKINDTIFTINLIAIVITLILSALGLRFAKTLSNSGIAIFLGIGIAQSLSIGGVCIDLAFFLNNSRMKFNYK